MRIIMKLDLPLKRLRASFYTVVGMLLIAPGLGAEQAELVDLAKEVGLGDVLGYSKAISMVDVNGDGWEDLWDSNTNRVPQREDRPSPPRFYLSQQDGTFKPHDLGIDPADLEFTWGAAWADFDNDGDPDLLLGSGGFIGDGNLTLYENHWSETKKLVKLPAGITTAKREWWGVSWGDYNNDGCLDFAAVAREGRASIYRNNCDKTFTNVAEKLGVSVKFKDARNPVWFDFDNDGDQDLYLAAIRRHRLYRNDRDAGFADVTNELGILKPADLVFAATSVDFNHDGNLDLYLGRQALPDQVAFGAGDGTFSVVGPEIGIVTKTHPDNSENTMGLGVGDVDNDGYIDILIGTGGPSESYQDLVFCNRPKPESPFGIEFYSCNDFAKAHGRTQVHGIAVGDLNQDGSNDVVFNIGGSPLFDFVNGTDSRGTNTFYTRKGGNPQTAQFRLEGVKSNRDAIGARIRVTVPRKEKPAKIFHYSVRSAEGFQSQNSSWRLINLMGSEQAEIEVRWPSGVVSQHAIQVGARVTFQEPVPAP